MSFHFALGLGISSSVLEITILIRAIKGKYVSRFPFFYSYLTYVFLGSALIFFVVRPFWPRHYLGVFWFYFLVSLLAEFAVLVEISDHIFNPYPAIRSLGRWLTFAISALFLSFYILPALMEPRSSGPKIMELVKRSSVTKAVIIILLLLVVHYFDLALTRNTSGMMAGLGIYLASNIVNFELGVRLGYARYSNAFAAIGPLSYTICLLAWTIALWHYGPAVILSRRSLPEHATLVPDLLGRFNNSLSRLLRK